MVSTTYGDYRLARATGASDERPQSHRGFFVRLMDSIAESRQRAAMIEITKHAHLLSPAWFEQMDPGASSCARHD
jgi:hypothetical protein